MDQLQPCPYFSRGLLKNWPFIRAVRVLPKPRLIFSGINGILSISFDIRTMLPYYKQSFPLIILYYHFFISCSTLIYYAYSTPEILSTANLYLAPKTRRSLRQHACDQLRDTKWIVNHNNVYGFIYHASYCRYSWFRRLKVIMLSWLSIFRAQSAIWKWI